MSNPANQRLVVLLALTAWGGSVGCGPMIELEEGGESGDLDGTTTNATSPPGTTATPPPGTTTLPPSTTAPPPDPDSTSTDGGGFIFDGFDSGPVPDCDLFAQDCPLGEKCMPWANDGGTSWNASRCVPIANDPSAVGEPCTVEGSPTSGIDSCDGGSMCWNVDPVTLEGTCFAMCIGSPERPSCEDPSSTCSISGDGVIALCIPLCDPLAQDCPEGQACYGVNDAFHCFPDASGDVGAPGDACEFINVCDPGTACVNAPLVPDCPGMVGCCTSFCDLTDPMPPCLPGQECVPWYDGVVPPAGYENVGVCVLP